MCQHTCRKRTRWRGVWMRAFQYLPLWPKFCSRSRPQAAEVYTDAPSREQRMLLRLQPYDVTIRYRPGKQMNVAFSRLSSDEAMPIPNMNVQIYYVCPQFWNGYLQKIQEQTPKDPELAALKEVSPRPWHTVGTDLFYLDNDEYLLIANYYTKYPFVRKIPRGQSTRKCVVDITKQILS